MEKADSMTITTAMHVNGLDAVRSDVHAIDASNASDVSDTHESCSSDKEVGGVEGLVERSCGDGPDIVVAVVVAVNNDDGGTDSDSDS